MKLYSIYSGGGGGGEWNGANRIFTSLPQIAKQHTLLKYGDIFLNHTTSSGTDIIRSKRKASISNLRDWLYERTQDPYVYSMDILLDTGAAKITSWIQGASEFSSLKNIDETIDALTLLEVFSKIIDQNDIIHHYAEIIVNSNVNHAVTIDIPNPFKMRGGDVDRVLSVTQHNMIEERKYVDLCLGYANKLYNKIVSLSSESYAQTVLMPTVDAQWNNDELDYFLSNLDFIPTKLALGGLIGGKRSMFERKISAFKNWYNKTEFAFTQIHLLGCGGIANVKILKKYGFDEIFSVDVSTPINRAIDGAVTGKTRSGYYKYSDFKLIRICKENIPEILEDHSKVIDPLFSCIAMDEILKLVLQHQSNKPGPETYEARAKLFYHNYDVYRRAAK